MVGKKLYVHGGIGAIPDGERFGENYELPNLTTYAETCAAIGSVYWNYRMFLLHGDSKYMDVLEHTLYNGLISGVGLDGKSFFYTNAMQITQGKVFPSQEAARAGWFTCSCCPTNVARLLPSVPGYMYAVRGRDVYVNLYITGKAEIGLGGKEKIRLEQESNYPWEGDVKVRVDVAKAAKFGMLLRIPGWVRGEAVPDGLYQFAGGAAKPFVIKVNGQVVEATMRNGYAVLDRQWKNGDVVELGLPMQLQTVTASDSVKEDRGKVAFQRGPILYCAEWADNGGRTSNIILPGTGEYAEKFVPELLHGVVTVDMDGERVVVDDHGLNVSTRREAIHLIPYYAWANRGKGEMNVWFPKRVTDVELLTQ
jgi:DUF1680 family protein